MSDEIMKDEELDLFWKKDPELIKKFLDQKDDYEQLCSEIAYILKKALKEQKDIGISAVVYRSKTLKSFLEKIIRKQYKKPFHDVTDFAGVRVVFLYRDDLNKIEEVIKAKFDVIEKVDKLNSKDVDKFGYGAVHYIAKLKKDYSGARYDDLKDLKCEIQVRTVLQDAWAIIDHHLMYKNKQEIPTSLQKDMSALSGFFYSADKSFETLRKERDEYLRDKERESNKDWDEFLSNEFNLDTFTTLLKRKFPNEQVENAQGQLNGVFSLLKSSGFNLQECNRIVEKYKDAADSLKKEPNLKNEHWSSASLIFFMFAIEIEGFGGVYQWPELREIFHRYRK
jgi:ppGpp synthetase/RelA/SpoT-type nucleotidyltranferase